MSRTFHFRANTHHVTCDTAEEAYASGYEIGKSWTAKYRPGGPWRPTSNHMSDQGWFEYCVAMTENNAQWLKGFDAGKEAQNARTF
jgi:hypothetical protein